jgi:hypothetical protein
MEVEKIIFKGLATQVAATSLSRPSQDQSAVLRQDVSQNRRVALPPYRPWSKCRIWKLLSEQVNLI